jgi:hypothetical protein
VTTDPTQTLVDELARLPVVTFVDVLHRVFDTRADDVRLRHFDRSYVLAVSSIHHPEGELADPSQVEVEFVARPTDEQVEDDLAESGTCSTCHLAATSTSKLARCAVCGAEVGLT